MLCGAGGPASAGNDRLVAHSAPCLGGVGAGSVGLPDTQVFLDYDRARGHRLCASGSVPLRGGVPRSYKQPLGPSGSSHDCVLFPQGGTFLFLLSRSLPLRVEHLCA